MEKTLEVKGMTCGHCEKAVKGALEELNGIDSANVHLEQNTVDVSYDEAKVSEKEMKDAIEDQGYDVV
ncbi:copper chaperone CopZ [Pontibacillus yanchengensis]|uniref:Copper chaperone CopZ n=2 Tax=Pontibacillus yanchengensis TaxID=462910 RepID=A0ACC7VDC8_9BACI|nr:copper chaperone CopZ [Pontibacillus yanchengensis]MYL32122.1 copper chaperone CopZ [Pontibacillus yanchengensis]MYL52702.1 copper chaperone CopZ [Pontibacillus yanchengensis]